MTMKVDWMRGCATALLTPFKSDGSIDEDRMRSLVDRQIEGVLYSLQSTEEFLFDTHTGAVIFVWIQFL